MDAGTLAVLRDIAVLVAMMMVLGLAAYAWLRQTRPALAWHGEGRVDVRPFDILDGLLISMMLVLMVMGFVQASPAAEGGESTGVQQASALAILSHICLLLMLCAMLLIYLRVVRGLNPLSLFGLTQLRLPAVLGMAVLFLVPAMILVNGSANLISEWLKTFWPGVQAQDTVQLLQESKDPVTKILMIVAAVVVAPLVEEVMFRGFLYGVVKRFTDGYFAALVSALCFALVHCHVPSFLPLALLALSFCLAYEMTGSLLVPITMHALFNGTSVFFLLYGTSS